MFASRAQYRERKNKNVSNLRVTHARRYFKYNTVYYNSCEIDIVQFSPFFAIIAVYVSIANIIDSVKRDWRVVGS